MRSPEASRSTLFTALAAAAIVAAGLAAYSNSFRGPFIFDDKFFVDQPAAQHLWPPGPLLAAPRPVAEFTLALNHTFGGGVWGYHAFNLAVHLLAALTLFGVVRRTLNLMQPQIRHTEGGQVAQITQIRERENGEPLKSAESAKSAVPPLSDQTSTAIAFCIALLWALHPLQTESVTYIIQRMESLMGLFYLLTLYCFIRAVAASNQGAEANWKLPIANCQLPIESSSRLESKMWSAAAVVACALGMGSKEVMVTAPLLVLLYDRTFIAGSFREALRRRWGLYLALAATWLILARPIVAALAPQGTSAGFGLQTVTPFEYARSELGVICHYLTLALWPSGLCLDYAWPVARTTWDILPGAIVVGVLLAFTVWALARRPAWGFLGAWFFLVLAPTSSIVPVADLAFEHRMYLPLAAVVTAAVLAAHRAARKPAQRGIAVALALAAAVALGCLTFQRNADYQSDITIWKKTTDERPKNARAWNYLGEPYLRAGDYDNAVRCCSAAISLKPDFAEAYNNRAAALIRLRRYKLALRDCDDALKWKPDWAEAFNHRAAAHVGLNQYSLAVEDCDQAIRMKPDFAMAWYNRGEAHGRMRQYDLARTDFDHAIRLMPDYADAYHNRAVADFWLKNFDQAWADVKTARRLGCEPNPQFLTALKRASGREE